MSCWGWRAPASGAYLETYRAFSERPVLPVRAVAGGERYERQHTAGTSQGWQVWEAKNFPLMMPRRFVSPQDVADFGLALQKNNPHLARVLSDIRSHAADPRHPLSEDASYLLSLASQEIGRRASVFAASMEPPHEAVQREAFLGGLLSRWVAENGVYNVMSGAWAAHNLGAAAGRLAQSLVESRPAWHGLQHTLRRGVLPLEPKFPETPITAAELDATLHQTPDAVDGLVASLNLTAPLGPHMRAAHDLVADHEFARASFLFDHHCMRSQVVKCAVMQSRGLRPSRATFLGVPYSTNFPSQLALRALGMRAITYDVENPRDIRPVLSGSLRAELDLRLSDLRSGASESLVYVGDAAMASEVVAQHFPEYADRIVLVNKTASGTRKLQKMSRLPCIVVDYALSPHKRQGGESEAVAEAGFANVARIMKYLGMRPVDGQAVGILGAGPIGIATAMAFRARGCRIEIYDPDEAARDAAAAQGFEVSADRDRVIREKAAVGGCSGTLSIRDADLRAMRHECVVFQMGSKADEIDDAPNSAPDVEVIPVLAEGPGDRRFVTRVWRFEDRDIVAARNLFPVTFDGSAEPGGTETFDTVRALEILACEQGLEMLRQGKPPGHYFLDPQRADTIVSRARAGRSNPG